MEIYKDPIIQKYITLIQSKTGKFKRFYFGDPIRVGASELPAVIIAKVNTQVSNLSNTEDEHRIQMSITVVTDIRETISDDKTMVKGTNDLYELLEGRNANYTLKDDALLNIIRHDVELDVGQQLRTDLNTTSTIDYAMTMGKRVENHWSLEGTLTFVAHFTQVR